MRRQQLLTAIASGGLLLLVLLVYWQGLAGPFLLDDIPNILAANQDSSLRGIIYSVTHNTSGMLGRGVSMLSFAVSRLQFGLDPWGFKFHNLLLHLACGALIARLAFLLLMRLDQGPDDKRCLLIAGSAAAFWLLHPLQVSTVLYAVQRMTQLSAFFTLLALLVHLEARDLRPGARYFLLAWLLFPVCLLCALLSKETGALIPLYLLAIEVLVFRSSPARLRQRPQLAFFLLCFVLLPLLAGSIYVLTHFSALSDYGYRSFTLEERLLTQLHVLAFYIRMIFLPRLRELGLYHDDFPLVTGMDAFTLLLLLALAGLCLLVWFCRRRAPVLAFGLSWFLISHLLESTFIPLELVFEHRNYLALFGLLLPPLYYSMTLSRLKPARAGLVLLLGLFVFQTSLRAKEWSSEALFSSVAVADHPDSSRARTFLANYLFEQGQVDAALMHLREAQRLRPEDAGATLHQLSYLCLAGVRDDELLSRAEQLLGRYPASIYSLNALENIQVFRGRGMCETISGQDLERLIAAALEQADNAENSENYGYLLRLRGILHLNAGRYAAGVIDLRTAHEKSGVISILGDLIKFQIQLGRFADARDMLDLMGELNTRSHGVNRYLLDKLEAELEAGRQRAAEQAGAEAGTQ